MKIGFVGLGKLGLPTAVTIAMKDHDVMGYDIDPNRMTKTAQEYKETGPMGDGDFNSWLAKSSIHFGTLQEVIAHGDIVFCAVQTPHQPLYEGITPLPENRVDFDYSYLIDAIRQINEVCTTPTILSIISTVLPGTIAREIMPIIANNKYITLVYNPGFTANGTVMQDYLNQEFILLGCEKQKAITILQKFYSTITDAPTKHINIESAELAKVLYNTFITLKIDYANTILELCHKISGADSDEITDVLMSATTRLVSTAYMKPGMGDGGACHPRDNIAMSWLARQHKLSFDIFDAAIKCRERQAEWLARIVIEQVAKHDLPVVFMGTAFKAETNLTVGSPALLTAYFVENLGCDVTCADANVETTVTEAIAGTDISAFHEVLL
jgi:UDPglucose 6-dehydrogenase